MTSDRTRKGGELTAGRPPSGAPGPKARGAAWLVPPTRYRHPGDVIRLIAGGLVLAVTLATAALAHRQLLGPGAATVTSLGSGSATRLLVGLVQVAFVGAAAVTVVVVLWHRRFRLLVSLVTAAVLAGAALYGILSMLGDQHPPVAALSGNCWYVRQA